MASIVVYTASEPPEHEQELEQRSLTKDHQLMGRCNRFGLVNPEGSVYQLGTISGFHAQDTEPQLRNNSMGSS
jgi:hypothetical protein